MRAAHRTVRPGAIVALIVAVVLGASVAQAATLNVSPAGSDSPDCGPPTDRCATPGQAVDNASDGDTILIDPGLYEFFCEEGEGCECGLRIDKDLSVRANEGADVTFLFTNDNADYVVCIDRDGVTLGLDNHGFTISGGSEDGLYIDYGVSDVYLGGNIAFNNGDDGFDSDGFETTFFRNLAIKNDGDGFGLQTDESELSRNRAFLNGGDGFRIRGTGDGKKKNPGPQNNLATFNVAYRNGGNGFSLDGDSLGNTLDKNIASLNEMNGFDVDGEQNEVRRGVAIGNGDHGIDASGSSHFLRECHLIDNGEFGMTLDVVATSVTRNNLYNQNPDSDNCQMNNDSGETLPAPANFFGVPVPGPETVCGGPIDRTPISSTEFTAAFGWLPVP